MAATAEGPHPFSSEHGSKVLQRFWQYYGARAHGRSETLPAHYPDRGSDLLLSPGSVARPIMWDCHPPKGQRKCKGQNSYDSGSNPDQGAIVTGYRKTKLMETASDSRNMEKKRDRLEWARNSVWKSGWLLTNLSRVQIPSGPLL